jgi:circadian clock protein KaiC
VAGQRIKTGIVELDTVLAGGLDHGTSTLLMGPAGSGKSSLAIRVALVGLERGEKVALYLFDEHVPILLERSAGLGMELRPYVENGQLLAPESTRPNCRRANSCTWCRRPSRTASARW